VAVAQARHRASRRAAHRHRPAARDDVPRRKEVAALVREVLAEIGYTGWPKTSGTAGSTSSAGSSRTGSSRSCGAPRSRSRARSSVGCRRR
jgi:hypothetical protein